jgi:predicted RNA-binding Zn ribbon-like protein
MFLPPDQTPHVSGSRLCLGMVNTVLWRRSSEPIERLQSYADAVHYVERAGWLENSVELVRLADAHPRKSRASLGRVLGLREVLFRLFSDIASGRQPAATDLQALNERLTESLGELEIRQLESGAFQAAWRNGSDLDVLLWQIAASAGDVVASEDRRAIKQCPGEQCGWVFIDESNNRSRRWCDSRLCGNRARVRAHYQRSRAS